MVITRHRRIPRTADKDSLVYLASIRVCDRLVAKAGIGLNAEHPFETVIDPLLIEAAGIDQDILKNLIEKLPEIMKAADDGSRLMLLVAQINQPSDNLLTIHSSRELIEQLDQILLQYDAQLSADMAA